MEITIRTDHGKVAIDAKPVRVGDRTMYLHLSLIDGEFSYDSLTVTEPVTGCWLARGRSQYSAISAAVWAVKKWGADGLEERIQKRLATLEEAKHAES